MISKNDRIYSGTLFVALVLSGVLPATTALAQEVAAASATVSSVQVVSPGTVQAVDLKTLLAGTHFPLTIKFSSLTPEFRHLVLPPQNDAFATYMQLRGTSAGLELGVYFTRGETVQYNGDTYLAAYRPEAIVDIKQLRIQGSKVPGIVGKPWPNNNLVLSLLNMRTTGSFTDIRPFDAKLDALSPEESNEASLRHLSLLTEPLQAYMRDHNNKFPPVELNLEPGLQKELNGYAKEKDAFTDPVNGQDYVANPAIAGQVLQRLTNANFLVAFAQAAPAADGLRAVLFFDGHVERVNEERWTRLKAIKPVVRPLPSPAEVMAKVKAGLASQNALNAISLDCGPGVLRLTGTVDTLEQYRLAGKIARREAPDYKVINQLKVQPTAPEPTAY